MLSISNKKFSFKKLSALSKKRKIQIAVTTAIIVILLGALTVFLVTRNKPTVKKQVTATKTSTKKTPKATATTEDVTADLNAINAKSSSLDNEINDASTGLSDQQGDLTY